MISPAVLKARYPDPPPPPASWLGWRRPKGKHGFGVWQKVAATEAPTRGTCYQKLMELSDLVGGETVWQFAIMPAEQRPGV